MHTYVIAEAGSTHDSNLSMALDLVKIAKDAGADAVKYQFWSSAERMAERRRATKYLSVYIRYGMPCEWLPMLAERAASLDIDFMATAYLPEDIAVVGSYVAKFKVASFEALDTNFIIDHVGFGKDIIVSTGMMTAKETLRLLSLRPVLPELKVLHCVSAYPTPLENLNLAVIRELGLDGFSDHSGDSQTGEWATLAGARILEIHFRHPDTLETNPDYAHSLLYLEEYVEGVRWAEKLLGSPDKAPQAVEADMARYRVPGPSGHRGARDGVV